MGNPAIWYHTNANGPVVEIDLKCVSMIEPASERFRTDEEGITGRLSTTDYGMRMNYRIARERFAGGTLEGEDLVAQLMTFENHCQRGGRFGFAFDRDTAWAGFANVEIERGVSSIATRGNVFRYNTSAVLGAGDRVVIQSGNPEGRVAHARVLAQVGNVLTLAAPFQQRFCNHPILIHQRDFFPVCRMAAGSGPILTTDGRRNYTLNIECQQDVTGLMRFSNFGGTLTGSAAGSPSRSQTTEQIITADRIIARASTTLLRPQ